MSPLEYTSLDSPSPDPEEPCSGPNHGHTVLPEGRRHWVAGTCLSIDQFHGDKSTHNVFCGPDCLCDWQGWFAAIEQGMVGEEEIPGTFLFVWISPWGTTVATYPDWATFSGKISEYLIALSRPQGE